MTGHKGALGSISNEPNKAHNMLRGRPVAMRRYVYIHHINSVYRKNTFWSDSHREMTCSHVLSRWTAAALHCPWASRWDRNCNRRSCVGASHGGRLVNSQNFPVSCATRVFHNIYMSCTRLDLPDQGLHRRIPERCKSEKFCRQLQRSISLEHGLLLLAPLLIRRHNDRWRREAEGDPIIGSLLTEYRCLLFSLVPPKAVVNNSQVHDNYNRQLKRTSPHES